MSLTLRPVTVFPITTRTLVVLRVADITPVMRRVTLGGPELAAHTAENGFPVEAFRSEGFDDEFKLILQHPDAPRLVAPEQADGVLSWPRGDKHLVFRTYTVRRWDPARRELDIDFVRHGSGPAASWAETVERGAHVQIAGPKSSAPHPEGADWCLIAGDETALPAIGRWLDEWPTGARAQVFIEIADSSHQQDLQVPDGVRITWLCRNGAEPGTTTLLFDAIRAAEWWDGVPFAWVAGETLTLIPIRRWLRNEKNLVKSQVDVTGYWRRQEVLPGATDEAGPRSGASKGRDEEEIFHDLTELMPPFALRVAASIGLAAAFDGQLRSAEEIASRTRSNPVGVAKLLRYLEALELVEIVGPDYRLTSLGRELEDSDTVDALRLDGGQAGREIAGALALLAAVRTGAGDHSRWFSGEWKERELVAGVHLDERIEREAEDAVYIAAPLADAACFAAFDSIAVLGRGAGVVAAQLTQRHETLRATVVAAPSEISALQRLHAPHERVSYAAAGPLSVAREPVSAVLLVDALGDLRTADAAHLVGEAAAWSGAGGVLTFGEVLEPALADEHDYEHDLIEFALSGGGLRTDAEHRAIFSEAGLDVTERLTIGWGYTLYRLAALA